MGSIDILPTILSEARIKNRQNFERVSLSGKLDNDRGFFSFGRNRMYCFIYNDWKLIKYPFFQNNNTEYIKIFFPEYGSEHYQLFNIERVSEELTDLKNTDAPQFKNMLFKILQEARKKEPMAKKTGFLKLNEEEKEKLRALGYAQ